MAGAAAHRPMRPSVRALPPCSAGEPPGTAWVSDTAMTSAPRSDSFLRRLSGVWRTRPPRAGSHGGASTIATAASPDRPATAAVGTAEHEAELAERLDTLLGIAGRLAATPDRRDLLPTIVDETNRALRADSTTLRLLRDDRLEVVATAGLTDAVVATLPTLGRDEGWAADVFRTRTVQAFGDVRLDERGRFGRYGAIPGFAGDLIAPLIHEDRVIGTLSAVTNAPRSWTAVDVAFISNLATHTAIALANAELLAQTTARAAQLEVLHAASARMSRATTVEEIGRTVVEEMRRIVDYHDARVYLVEPPDRVVPIAFEGRVGAYRDVDRSLMGCRLGEGLTGWVALHGEPIVVDDARSDPRGASIAGTDDIDESMLVVPMRYDEVTVGVIALSRLGLDGFTGDDLRVLTIVADRAATAIGSARLLARTQDLAGELRRLLDMSAELSGSLDPHQVADLMADHLARAMGVDECIISYWDRPGGRVESLGYFPPSRLKEIEPSYDVAGYPETLRVLERQETAVIRSADPHADPAEVELMTRGGNQVLAMLPLVAKGQSIGLVELVAATPVTLDDERLELARTMANEAAMALENARLYEDARNRADHDPLTGFYNHRFLHERLGEEVVRSRRARHALSVLMLDLDDFKLVNDTFGHLFGDRVLTWTAELIRSVLRASDIPARYGGDEFAVILPETDEAQARIVAGRILEAFRDRAFVGEQRGPVPVGVSIGVASFPMHGRTGTDLIAAADRALYRVKREGGHEVAGAMDPAT
jgi:diguanylate cyclase (GGDEF)-like protein